MDTEFKVQIANTAGEYTKDYFNEPNDAVMTFHLPKKLKLRIEKVAKENNRKASDVLRMAMNEWLSSYEMVARTFRVSKGKK